jgi:N-acetylglucosaminyldiphosphoundecaprenol N-acetyl-beta-D-mannosaminyltransferase
LLTAPVFVSVTLSVVRILGIDVYDESLGHALNSIIETCLSNAPRSSRLISATGAHGLVHAQRNPQFAETLRAFNMNLPDGLPGVWVGKYVKGAARMERMRGADFFRALIMRAAATPIRHYFCGGKEGVAVKLRDVCRDRFGNPNVCGFYCPPFRSLSSAEWQALAADVRASGADIVWIGLSTPKQETFAQELASRVEVHYIATIGAAFDFHIGAVREAPLVVQRSGFEWLYRMLHDPKRLVWRYAEVVPLFLLYNLRDVFRERKL